MIRKRAPSQPRIVPVTATQHERNAFAKWMRYCGGRGCWGLWIANKATRRARLAAHMRRVRQDHTSKYFPPGTPAKIQRQFYNFLYTNGRCSFASWYAWVLCKGPHPLNWL